MDKDIAISLKNVSKTFKIREDAKFTLRSLFASFFNQGKTRRFKALNNINLDIKKGEFVGIIGKNGSGKSTLLKIIAGIYDADKGSSIKVNGKLVPFLELGVGFNLELSGKENVYLNGTILGMTKKFLDQKYEEIVQFAELWDFMEMPVKNYSSGMIVRLAFSIAIQADAEIYILDEILSVGDTGFQKKSLQTIKNMKIRGKTILFVSHSTGAVKEMCDRAILINEHVIQAEGNPEKVTLIYDKLFLSNQNTPIEVKEIDKNNNSIKFSSGGEKAEITSYAFFDHTGKSNMQFETNKEFTIKLQIHLKQAFTNPLMLGIMIKDDDKHQLFGLHSKFSEPALNIPNLPVGSIVEIICKSKVDLNQGNYLVSFVISELFDKAPYYDFEDLHHLVNYETISVFSDKFGWGKIPNNPQFSLNIIK